MEAKSLAARLDEVQVLDVREDFEWEGGRIAGARHIPLSELPERLGELHRQGPVVAVCFAGARSARAAQFLQARGYEAINLDGGLKSWIAAGLPLIADRGLPGSLIHDPPVLPRPVGESAAGGSSLGRQGSGGHAAAGGEVHHEKRDDPVEQTEPVAPEVAGVEGSEDLTPEMESLKDAFIEVVFAAQERFGDEEPPEEDMRKFMKDWLISKGRTPDEAEDLLGP